MDEINVFYGQNGMKDKDKLFKEEIKIKKLKIINQVNLLNDNYKQLIHEIPGGQMKYFWNITLTTSVVSIVGFLIIFRGVMNYISGDYKSDKLFKMKKNESSIDTVNESPLVEM